MGWRIRWSDHRSDAKGEEIMLAAAAGMLGLVLVYVSEIIFGTGFGVGPWVVAVLAAGIPALVVLVLVRRARRRADGQVGDRR